MTDQTTAPVPVSLKELELLGALVALFSDRRDFTFSPERTACMCRQNEQYFAGCATSLLQKGLLIPLRFPQRHGVGTKVECDGLIACRLASKITVYWSTSLGKKTRLLSGVGHTIWVEANVRYNFRSSRVTQALFRKLCVSCNKSKTEETMTGDGPIERITLSVAVLKALLLLMLRGVNHEAETKLATDELAAAESLDVDWLRSAISSLKTKRLLATGVGYGKYLLGGPVEEVEIARSQSDVALFPEIGTPQNGTIVRVSALLEKIRATRSAGGKESETTKEEPTPPPAVGSSTSAPVTGEARLETLAREILALAVEGLDRTPLTGNPQVDLPRIQHNIAEYERVAVLLARVGALASEYLEATRGVEKLYRDLLEIQGKPLPSITSGP